MFRASGGWSVLGLAIGLLTARLAVGGLSVASPEETKEKAEGRPEVQLEVIPENETVEPGQEILLHVRAVNTTDTDLGNLRLHAVSTRFRMKHATFPASLPAFGSVRADLRVWPRSAPEASYGPWKILFLLDYRWQRGGETFTSSQTATVTLTVRRKFEEATGGLLGGGTALFYLLLPILPAYLVYQLAEKLRRGEGLHLPTLSQENLLAAFFLAVSANLVLLLLPLSGWKAFDYSNPTTLAAVLAISAGLGVLVPASRALVAWLRMTRWGIREDDCLEDYLKKALLAPGTPRHFTWATVGVGGADWQGILLVQPNGRRVLGPQLQVSVSPGGLSENEYAGAVTATRDLVERIDGGAIEARKALIEGVQQKRLTISGARFVLWNGQRAENPRYFVERTAGEMAVKSGDPAQLLVFPGGGGKM